MRGRRVKPYGRATQRGSAVLYAVVLSPVLLVSLALAVQLGALELQRERVRSAVDEAAVVAATRAASTSQTGIGLDGANATSMMRTALIDNLSGFQDQFAGVTATQIAEGAEIYVIVNVPAADPFDASRILVRPTLEARVRVPVATGLLTLANVPTTLTLTLTTSADLRRTGAGDAP